MPSVILYDEQNGTVKSFRTSVDPSPFEGWTDALIYDDTTNPTEQTIKNLVASVGIQYLKVVAGAVGEMTPAEKAATDAALSASVTAGHRTSGKAILLNPSDHGVLLRAFADIVKDELNNIRGWLVSFKAAVNSASTLADLKIRVAALPNMPDRSLSQLKTAIESRIDSGGVDQ